ncbi:MAG: winged helix-turn-helix transcriptional regulator [Clostridia bacterium]|nr:winged helix-turn-helix transcriptional regulator [Clostridia bacterium]
MEYSKTEYLYESSSEAELAAYFKLLSDPTRLRVIMLLSESEMCVGDISARLDMEQSAVSHQLRVLKSARIADCRRAGKTVLYRLTDQNIKNIIAAASRNFN